MGFEVKAMTTHADEYKVKMKAREVASKLAYAQQNGLRPGTMMVVMDIDNGVAYVYWREGIVSARLNRNWNFLAQVEL